jgi:preprotein translocase SecE subunit
MADVIAPPTAPASRAAGIMAAIRGIPAFYRSVVAEMRKVTWPEVADVRRATLAIIVFVLLLGLVIWLLDVALQGLLVRLIPSLFVGR